MQNKSQTTKLLPQRAHPSSVPLVLPVLFVLFVLPACTTAPFHGGHAVTTRSAAGTTTRRLSQGDNPSQPTTQVEEHLRLRTFPLSEFQNFNVSNSPFKIQRPTFPISEFQNFSVSNFPPTALVTDLEQTRTTTVLGAAQKDTSRETSAKLSSLRALPWIGAALFIFGLASLFWPPLKLIIASATTSIAIAAGGLALVILPTVLVGNELLLLGAVALGVGAWFLAHRHGELRGQLKTLTPQP